MTSQHHNHTHPALTVESLSAGYPGDRQAITGVSFEVGRGERIAVIGPNGAGKSTLFKAIVGLIPFTSGSISIFGEDCRTSHDLIGYVPQYNEIDWNFPATVGDVVMMGRARHIGWMRLPRRRDWETVHNLLEQVSMQGFINRQIGQLSGGQKRRVFIARALAQNADVVLLDEPFTGVDAAAEEEIMETLDILRKREVTVVLATHDMQMAAVHFDRLLLLKREIIAYGPPSQVLTPEHLRSAYGGGLSILQTNGETLVFADEHG